MQLMISGLSKPETEKLKLHEKYYQLIKTNEQCMLSFILFVCSF